MHEHRKDLRQRNDEKVIRERFPNIIPEHTTIHLKYWAARDLLTVLAGRQDRWSTKTLESGQCRLYLDHAGDPVRVEIPAATRLFPRHWLQQHVRRRFWPERF